MNPRESDLELSICLSLQRLEFAKPSNDVDKSSKWWKRCGIKTVVMRIRNYCETLKQTLKKLSSSQQSLLLLKRIELPKYSATQDKPHETLRLTLFRIILNLNKNV